MYLKIKTLNNKYRAFYRKIPLQARLKLLQMTFLKDYPIASIQIPNFKIIENENFLIKESFTPMGWEGSRWAKVVDKEIGGITAPVTGSCS